MKKYLLILAFLATSVLVAQSTLRSINLFWDANPVSENTIGYCVYEKTGTTNYMKLGYTTNTSFNFLIAPGLRTYVVTSTNFWGESEYSLPVSTPGNATKPVNVKVDKANTN